MLTKLVNPPLASTNGFNTDKDVSGEGMEVAIIKETQEERYWVLDEVYYSYNDRDAIGGLIIMDGDKTVVDLDLPNPQGNISFYLPASPGKDLKVMLKPGGANMIGKLMIQTHLEFPV